MKILMNTFNTPTYTSPPLPLLVKMATSALDYKFKLEPEESLKCFLCRKIATDPKQHDTCGQLFCEACLEEAGLKTPCAHCKGESPGYFSDARSQKSIKALQVICNQDVGECQWVGPFEDIQKHIDRECRYTEVKCTNKCTERDNKTVTKVMRMHLQDHLKNDCPLRPYSCAHCHKKATYLSITRDHYDKCSMKRCACPHTECRMMIEQKLFEKHKQNCQYAPVPCKYAILGCNERKLRKYIEQHEKDDTHHLQLAMATIVSMKREEESKPTIQFVFQISNVPKKCNENYIHSEPFYTSRRGYHLQLDVHLSVSNPSLCENLVNLYLYMRKGKNDSQLQWPFLGTMKIELLNQLEDNNHLTRSTPYSLDSRFRVGTHVTIPNFISHSQLFQSKSSTQYLLNDTIYFRVWVKVDSDRPWLEGDKPCFE